MPKTPTKTITRQMFADLPTITEFPSQPDIPALRHILDVISKVPKTNDEWSGELTPNLPEADLYWNQRCWRMEQDTPNAPACGTAFCAAGFTAELSPEVAWEYKFDPEGERSVTDETTLVVLKGIDAAPDLSWPAGIYPGGGTVLAENFAKHRLGLNAEQADAFFYMGNTFEHLTQMVDLLEANPSEEDFSEVWGDGEGRD
jgi:hypothetical protein